MTTNDEIMGKYTHELGDARAEHNKRVYTSWREKEINKMLNEARADEQKQFQATQLNQLSKFRQVMRMFAHQFFYVDCENCGKLIHRDVNGNWEHSNNGMLDCGLPEPDDEACATPDIKKIWNAANQSQEDEIREDERKNCLEPGSEVMMKALEWHIKNCKEAEEERARCVKVLKESLSEKAFRESFLPYFKEEYPQLQNRIDKENASEVTRNYQCYFQWGFLYGKKDALALIEKGDKQ